MIFRAVLPFLIIMVIGAIGVATYSDTEKAPDLPLPQTLEAQSQALFDRWLPVRRSAINWLVDRGEPDAIPVLIQALRFSRFETPSLVAALRKLSGEDAGTTWFDWMVWLQAREDIEPFAGFDEILAYAMAKIDPAFRTFLYAGVRHEIRLAEVAWGGVRKDGIPALTNPTLLVSGAVDFLSDQELVFGIEINGDVRAYPLRIMDWHEMFNDVIGGVPVSLAYCTLCGSGILFETTVEGRKSPFVFGSSGFLYRSNKLMYDSETYSLWNQFTGRPVVGPLTGSGIQLKTRPVVITSWGSWRKRHPSTKVLSIDTGFKRNYIPGRPYGRYFSSPDLMFPALVDNKTLEAKDYVFALRSSGAEKAWPLTLFEDKRVINDTAGVLSLTLVGDSETRTVRAYRTEGQAFRAGASDGVLSLDGEIWKVTEAALVGPGGEKLHRLPGHVAYWFAWSGYLGKTGDVASVD